MILAEHFAMGFTLSYHNCAWLYSSNVLPIPHVSIDDEVIQVQEMQNDATFTL